MLGSKISHFEITGHLGSGGMGEVYRARDTKLGRDVAIKVLPPTFAAEPERCARFEREARLIAALNHPHIAAIYGIENDAPGSSRALVLELVEGETLAERLERGVVPLREALAIARQIAAALDAAHEKGIVHRDLKPANIKITPAGVVKVLDFGIAKALGDGTNHAGSGAATEVNTRVFGILGTAAYMCPEQARGAPVDKRADIWAFGCVLFELLTGTPAFARETTTDTLVRVVDHEPDWMLLPHEVPAHIRALLHRCLAKDPRQRLRDIGDAELDDKASLAIVTRTVRPLRNNLAWLLGGAVVAAAATFAVASFRAPPEAASVGSVNLRRLTDFVGIEDSPALSPDGKTVAFVARVGGFRQIWLRLLGGGAPLQITHDSVNHEEPRWAPDSTSLIYFTPSPVPGQPGTIWEIAALGGDARRLTTAVANGDISRDGRFLATLQFSGDHIELATLSRSGTEIIQTQPQRLTSTGAYYSPRWSPDGEWLAVRRSANAFDEQVVVLPAAGGEERIIARSSRLQGFSWLGDSSGVVYSSAVGSTVLYPPTRNLRVVGRDGTGDRQLTFGDVSYTQPDVLASGAIVATRVRVQSDLWRIPVDGTPVDNTRAAVRITRQTGQAQAPSVSPDGQEIAYLSDSGGHGNVWVTRADGSAARQITFEQDPSVSIGVPVWSSTGRDIAVIVSRGGVTGLWLVRPDGSAFRPIVPSGISATWSSDDTWLYYSTTRNGPQCIEKIPPGGGDVVTVRCDDAIVTGVSPDGSTLYFIRYLTSTSGVLDSESLKAMPEDAEATSLARVTGTRVPDTARQLVPTLSPDGAALVMPLIDGDTTNIWVQPTSGEPMRAITDFGDRAVLIARRVAWAPDGRSVYAAVADTDADIVLLEGLRP